MSEEVDTEAAEKQGYIPMQMQVPTQTGPLSFGILATRPSAESEAGNHQTSTQRLRDKLAVANKNRQNHMDRKTQLVLMYTDALERLPDDASKAQNEALAKQQFDHQMRPIEEDLNKAEAHYQLLVNTLEAKEAMLQEHHNSRSQTPLSMSSSSSNHKSVLDVAPMDTNRKHLSLARVFNYKTIPVVDLETMEIDYSRVQLKDRKGAPTLDLKLESTARNNLSLKVVKGVVDFLNDFEAFYKDELTEDLFDDLAWRYMARALKAADLNTQYERLIKQHDYDPRHWKEVERCLSKMFKFDLMRSEILGQLFNLKVEPQEDANSFVDRVEVLIKATGTENMGLPLYSKITATLPDAGQEKVLAAFNQQLETIPSVSALLSFIRRNPSVMTGSRSDPCAWLINKFAKKSSLHMSMVTQDNSSSKTSMPFSKQQNNKGNGKGGNRFHGNSRTNAHPYQNRRNNNNGSSSSTNIQKDEAEDKCKDPMCRRFGRLHRDANCIRHKNPERFAEMNKRAQKKPDNQGTSPALHQTAALSQTDVIQETSFTDTLGSDFSYDTKDLMDIDNYDESHSGSIDDIDPHVSAYIAALQISDTIDSQLKKIITKAPVPKTCRKTGFRGAKEGDNRIAVPITIESITYTALLDPGSTVSIIHTEVAKDLNIQTIPLKNKLVSYADEEINTPSIITRDKINLACNRHAGMWQVNVMRLGYYDFLIGMDLFPRFGFSLHGIALPIKEINDAYFVEDEKPALVPAETVEQEQEPDFIEQKKKFLCEIEPLLQANGQIDPKSHCPLDIMRVSLNVKDNCVIQDRSRRFYAQTEEDEVNATVQKWLDTGVIVEAPKGNPYNNSLTISARRDLEGNVLKYRVCLDPRNLNKQLIDTDNFPIPIINEVLERAAGHKYFTTIDLSQAYHRLPLDAKSQPYTAFKHKNKQYMFARAPFGLKPMTSIFQRGMSHLLGDLHFVGVYVDDIVIFSDSIEEHTEHVKLVIDKLTKAKLIINKEKSHFLRTQVLLLGFVIDAKGRKINPDKVANVKSWAPPTNGKMVQRYLGMFNYFREYIPLFSTIAAPLDKMRNVKGNFTLGDLEMRCFNQLKQLVTEAPVLSFPDFTQPFYVATDASNLGIGAVLYQLPNGPEDESKVNYISFMARALKSHERNYPAYKKELLGIIYACKKFHYYVSGRKFTLYTDHRPLTFIHEQKELPQILADWKEALFSYDFQCIY
jgi:hypothetical protein